MTVRELIRHLREVSVSEDDEVRVDGMRVIVLDRGQDRNGSRVVDIEGVE